MRRRMLLFLLSVVLVCLLISTAAAAERKLVALTFDDGPSPYTGELLDGLAERGVQATFFVQGFKVEENPEIIRRMIAEGHQVGNHTYDHPNLVKLSLEDALLQLTRTDDILNEVTGGSGAYYYRAPYGNSTEGLRAMLEGPMFYWTVDSEDWKDRDAELAREKIVENVFDGAIILVHDTLLSSVEGALAAVDDLQEQGYEFVTLKELFRRRGVHTQPGKQYYSYVPTETLLDPLAAPEIQVCGDEDELLVTLSSLSGEPVYYTVDGAPILYDAMLYEEPFSVALPCTIRAVTAADLNGSRSEELVVTYTAPPAEAPEAVAIGGQVWFLPAEPEDAVYYIEDGGDLTLADGPVSLTPDRWFTFFADGEHTDPSEEQRLLFSAQGNLFADVDCDSWYYEDLDLAAARGYLRAVGDEHTMEPETRVTRGMLAEILYRFSGERVVPELLPFPDVPRDSEYAEAVEWGYRAGIFSGMADGTFAPEQQVTRQELAKILTAYMQLEPQEEPVRYLDGGAVAPWAADAVQVVTELGIMQGSDGYFRPLNDLSRAEIAVIFIRLETVLFNI